MTTTESVQARLAALRRRAEEREERRQGFEHALSEVRLEGGDVSPQAAPLFEQFIDGEITDEELGQRLLALHRP